MKTCRICGQPKSLVSFSPHPNTRDKLCHECKKCCAEKTRNWYRKMSKNPEWVISERLRVRLRDRLARINGSKTEPTTEQRKIAVARYREKFPERRHATTALNNAINLGKIIRGTCEVCGSPRTDGHHDDYGRPLDVRWLCRRHHKELHSNIRDRKTLSLLK